MIHQELDTARVHDLLQIEPESLDPGCGAAPSWVRESLATCPWVVVRRAHAPSGQIAVGVRGATRSERWGGFCAKEGVRRIVRPEELLLLYRSSICVLRTPALKVLREIDARWSDLALPWGPTGSAGFELATGRPVTSETSDLDLVIRASVRLAKAAARSLWDRVSGLAIRIDVRIEAPECACSLEEYARESSTRVLLRYKDGPRLGEDPWSALTERANTEVTDR
jgi:phosphoribosyl-dephospho-CoA transferase